ncbi:ion channel [Aeromonas caviae]
MLTIFLVGIPVILVNMLLQSLVSVWCIRFYVKRFNRREGALAGMLALFGIITLVMLGNLAQIGVWGGLFLWLGEFDTLQEAVYHSGVNFATLGYGDIVMSPQWKLLGPLEAVNGALMIGLSGASMLAVLQHHIRNQLADSPPESEGPPAATPCGNKTGHSLKWPVCIQSDQSGHVSLEDLLGDHRLPGLETA